MSTPSTSEVALLERPDHIAGRFTAMGCPCEVLVDGVDRALARELIDVARREALRVERTFSRYRTDTIVHRINSAAGHPVTVDDETAALLDYGVNCYEASEGAFDVTSGVLRRVWRFDGGTRVPSVEEVRDVMQHVGWHRVSWPRPALRMPAGMEIDLGGIAKEYAVDRAAALIAIQSDVSCIVNFGGDIFASGPRADGDVWSIGIEDASDPDRPPLYKVDLIRGGLATSGDARRFVLHEGRRLGHILDARTGWPVEDAPHSVTVVAASCVEAGTLATLASLRGRDARGFLDEAGVGYRIA